jgi:transposase
MDPGDGERQKTRAFSELQSYYLFAEKFGRPGKGNDKGKTKILWVIPAGTLWCRFRGREVGKN